LGDGLASPAGLYSVHTTSYLCGSSCEALTRCTVYLLPANLGTHCFYQHLGGYPGTNQRHGGGNYSRPVSASHQSWPTLRAHCKPIPGEVRSTKPTTPYRALSFRGIGPFTGGSTGLDDCHVLFDRPFSYPGIYSKHFLSLAFSTKLALQTTLFG
jgi:hypothetical protein